MRLICALLIVPLLAVGCRPEAPVAEDPVVRVGDKVLLKSELEESVPSGLTPEETIVATDHYIRMWINDNLLYEVAQDNVADKELIDQLVENYKRSLVIFQYQEQLVSERLTQEISTQDILDYYAANKDKFQLDRFLVKGFYFKLPVDAPQLDRIRVWYRSDSPDAIANIEKYCVQNAVSYDYFVDSWVDFQQIIDAMPELQEPKDLMGKHYLEQSDEQYHYFLHVTEYLSPGDNAPFEYAQSTIREMIINQRKIDFLKQMEEDLYNKAMSKGQIIFYNE